MDVKRVVKGLEQMRLDLWVELERIDRAIAVIRPLAEGCKQDRAKVLTMVKRNLTSGGDVA